MTTINLKNKQNYNKFIENYTNKHNHNKSAVGARKIKGQAHLEWWCLVLQIKPNNWISLESGQVVQVQFLPKFKLKTEEPRIIERNNVSWQWEK